MGARQCKQECDSSNASDDPPACRPLTTVEQLLAWAAAADDEVCRAAVPLPEARDSSARADRPRLLACHDMRGGYLEDRLVLGGSDAAFYYFSQWSRIDLFVYFSHSLVTVPPPGWINAAHTHGVPCLGTLITEWDEGRRQCERMLGSRESAEAAAQQLADLAGHRGFDGWLVNIENSLPPSAVPVLAHFLRELTRRMHARVPGSQVVWYDAVTTEGKLEWQNTLNLLNRPFFDACDAIWINYTWKQGTPASVALQAGDRRHDVYMGVDCFGRGTFGGGGYGCSTALQAAASQGLSAALFATAWPFDCAGAGADAGAAAGDWNERDALFWSLISDAFPVNRALAHSLPLYTNFGAGRGRLYAQQGRILSEAPWYNLSLQSLLPELRILPPAAASALSARLSDCAACEGGGCLRLTGMMEAPATVSLFSFGSPLLLPAEGLHVSVTTANSGAEVHLMVELIVELPGSRHAVVWLEPPGGAGGSGGAPPPALRVQPTSHEAARFAVAGAASQAAAQVAEPSQDACSGASGKGATAAPPAADCGPGASVPASCRLDEPGASEGVACSYHLLPGQLARALGCEPADARLGGVDLLLRPISAQGGPGPPCRVDARLGELAIAAAGPHPEATPVARLAAHGIELASLPAPGGGRACELSLWLTWEPPRVPAHCSVWVVFPPAAGAGDLPPPPPRWLGATRASAYRVAGLPVPGGAACAVLRVQAAPPGGGVQPPLERAATLVVPCRSRVA